MAVAAPGRTDRPELRHLAVVARAVRLVEGRPAAARPSRVVVALAALVDDVEVTSGVDARVMLWAVWQSVQTGRPFVARGEQPAVHARRRTTSTTPRWQRPHVSGMLLADVRGRSGSSAGRTSWCPWQSAHVAAIAQPAGRDARTVDAVQVLGDDLLRIRSVRGGYRVLPVAVAADAHDVERVHRGPSIRRGQNLVGAVAASGSVGRLGIAAREGGSRGCSGRRLPPPAAWHVAARDGLERRSRAAASRRPRDSRRSEARRGRCRPARPAGRSRPGRGPPSADARAGGPDTIGRRSARASSPMRLAVAVEATRGWPRRPRRHPALAVAGAMPATVAPASRTNRRRQALRSPQWPPPSRREPMA